MSKQDKIIGTIGQEIEETEEEDGDIYDHESLYSLHEFGIDLDDGPVIYLFSSESYTYGVGAGADEQFYEPGVDFTMANRFLKNLQICATQWPEERLYIHMNTPGGSWIQGIAMFDAIRAYPAPITIINYAEARSMSSILFLAPNSSEDQRIMMPNSRFMFHTGLWGGEFTGTQAETEFRIHQKDWITMRDIYAEAMVTFGDEQALEGCMEDALVWRRLLKKEDEEAETQELLGDWVQLQTKLHEEVYLEPQEALDLGFADSILVGDWQSLKDEDEVEDNLPEDPDEAE